MSATRPPPAISGGTLEVLEDGWTAVAADPDRDAIYVADLKRRGLLATIPLEPGDEPGRVLEDGHGLVHVALRRGGAVVTLAPPAWRVLARRPVCAAPRGLAFDASKDAVLVACADGALVSLAALPRPDGRDELGRLQLERDLRDVVVDGPRVFVTRFRSAEILVLDRDGRIAQRIVPPSGRAPRVSTGGSGTFTPSVAWRLVEGRRGEALLLHQRALGEDVSTEPGGYGGTQRCDGLVQATVTRISTSGPAAAPSQGPALQNATLAVDVAFSRDRHRVAVVMPGNAHSPGLRQVYASGVDNFTNASRLGDCIVPPDDAVNPAPAPPPPPPNGETPDEPLALQQPAPGGEAIAVAFAHNGHVVVQTRDPARLEILTVRAPAIELGRDSRADSGHRIFHANSGAGLACASCHPEGGEDGRVWRFAKLGPRRTQSLRGGIVATAPFHWDGDLRDLGHLMGEVFSKRMQGPAVPPAMVGTLAKWLDAIPPSGASTAARADNPAVARGRALYHDARVGCATCHGGALLTNNATADVGTGQAFQVPSLRGLAERAPFMHDGCAATLKDRFTAGSRCGGGDKHGATSHLAPQQIDDLVAYLETL